eukprot:CAMPEP_0174820318 /NCGR_PEP_ID=MMETSP1107-20130205/4058_1 /TAXON_ID=36770 /ORGANISM="Paraphysomonas vestita, Strain GFlagA" /LENGTH=172 /DNA_ID=CAMNT_0016035395 /DNA_START=1550 /DNA_END=2065 /DNA_ORIENTATION=+
MTAMLNPDFDSEASISSSIGTSMNTSMTGISKQSQRRTSTLQRVNDKMAAAAAASSSAISPSPGIQTSSSSIMGSNRRGNKESSQLDNEVNNLLQSAKLRKESPAKGRKTNTDNLSTSSVNKKKKDILSPLKGIGNNYPEENESSGLSHIAVSDLATMIQSIKKESLQQMSM